MSDGSGIFLASIKSNVPPPAPAIFAVLLLSIVVTVELIDVVKIVGLYPA